MAVLTCLLTTQTFVAWAENGSSPGLGGKIEQLGNKVRKGADNVVRKTSKALKHAGRKTSEGLDKAGNKTSQALKSATGR